MIPSVSEEADRELTDATIYYAREASPALALTFEAGHEVRFRVPSQVSGSKHDLKYSLAYVVDGVCVLRFDNEAGKGNHFHRGEVEVPYIFTTLEQLLADFWSAVDDWGDVE